MLAFNTEVTREALALGFGVFDTFNLTEYGPFSFDGTHYGRAVNSLKAQLLLNYLWRGGSPSMRGAAASFR